MESAPIWYRDPSLVRQMPISMRLWAAYARTVEHSGSDRIPGGSFLLRCLDRLSRMTGGVDDVLVGYNGFRIAARPFDVQFFQALQELAGGSRIHRVMQALLRPGDWFIDIGANHGSYSLLASALVGSSGRITSVEANPEIAACLKKSMQLNCEGNSSVIECALGDRSGTIVFHFNPIGSGSGSLQASQVERGALATEVRLARFDEVVDWQGSNAERILVKCDVEGAEHAVFRGAESFLRDRRPTLIFECNPAGAAAAGSSLREILHFLSDVGYTQFCDSRDFPRRTPREELDVMRMGDFVALGRGCEHP